MRHKTKTRLGSTSYDIGHTPASMFIRDSDPHDKEYNITRLQYVCTYVLVIVIPVCVRRHRTSSRDQGAIVGTTVGRASHIITSAGVVDITKLFASFCGSIVGLGSCRTPSQSRHSFPRLQDVCRCRTGMRHHRT